VSYAGNYTFDGNTFVAPVDASRTRAESAASSAPGPLEGARLLLNPPRRVWGGTMQHQEMVWERVA
jgi:hypothetical protein